MSSSAKSTDSYMNNNLLIGLGVVFLIIVIMLILASCTESGKKYFEQFKNKIMPGNKLKELDIIMFISPTCPHCIKTIEMLEKEKQLSNIEVVNILTKDGQEIAKKYGADKVPVPSFISRKLRTSTFGARDNVEKLVKDLTMPEPSSGEVDTSNKPLLDDNTTINLIKDLQIVLFARDGCPYCVKAKDMCNENGIINEIKIIDITTPEGQEAASMLLPPGTEGVPAWVSIVTKKTTVGFKPLEQILNELK